MGAAFIDGIGKSHEFEGEIPPAVSEGLAEASHRKGLAWSATDQDVGTGNPVFVAQHGEVPMERNVRVVMGENGASEGFDLGEAQCAEAQRMPGDGCRLDP